MKTNKYKAKKLWKSPELLNLENTKTKSGSMDVGSDEGIHTGPTTTFAS